MKNSHSSRASCFSIASQLQMWSCSWTTGFTWQTSSAKFKLQSFGVFFFSTGLHHLNWQHRPLSHLFPPGSSLFCSVFKTPKLGHIRLSFIGFFFFTPSSSTMSPWSQAQIGEIRVFCPARASRTNCHFSSALLPPFLLSASSPRSQRVKAEKQSCSKSEQDKQKGAKGRDD